MSTRAIPVFAAVALTLLATAARAADAAESPQQLIKDVVFNELADHRHHGFFEYVDTKRTGQQTVIKAEIETTSGRVHRVLSQDGKPLSAEEEMEEQRRLDALLHDAGQQQKLQRDYQGDEDRIARIVGLLPDGFLYQFDGVEGEDIRLTYQPNPAFKPPTYEARVFHGMAGTLWVNAREKRLSRLQGRLVANVDFGYGLLGRLDKGGSFDMERVEATPGNWKTRVLNVHITGHVILLKNIGKDQEELRSDFHQVPGNLTLEEAEAVLERSAWPNESRTARLEAPKLPVAQKDPRKVPVGLALH
jgi:hypothetical protein